MTDHILPILICLIGLLTWLEVKVLKCKKVMM